MSRMLASILIILVEIIIWLLQEVKLPKQEPAPLMEIGEHPPDLLRDMPSTECLSALDALGKSDVTHHIHIQTKNNYIKN